MDSGILDVVLGLVLIYALLALLVSKVQESLIGSWRSARAKYLHAMVLEAVGRDTSLRDRMFANPTIFALSNGAEAASPRGGRTWQATGPSSIPADVFARALLVEIYDKGDHSHPNTQWATPQQFLADRAHDGASSSARVMGTLRTLLAGREGDWVAFEAAVAKWFTDIGDRADGWYQRSAQRWSLAIAMGLALALMVDTFQLAERLSIDPLLRRAVSTLAQQVNAVFPGGKDASTDPTQRNATALAGVPQAPALRADQALQSASTRLIELYFRNQEVARFDPNRQAFAGDKDVIAACSGVESSMTTVTGKTKELLSNPSSWIGLLPPLRAYVKQLRVPSLTTVVPQQSAASAPVEVTPGACQKLDKPNTLCSPSVGENSNKPKSSPPSKDLRLRHAFGCITNMVGWIGIAEGASNDAAVHTNLRAAALNLDQAADAILELIEDQGSGTSLTNLFKADPDAFSSCVGQPGASLAGLRQCVEASNTALVSLPLGWTERNRRLAFCKVQVVDYDAVLSDVPWVCGAAEPFAGNRALHIKPMVLIGPAWLQWLWFLLGCLITAFFVALGAPFWFDVLGRVAKLRAAGTKREAEPVPPPAPSPGGSRDPVNPDGPEPFSDARNEFERPLLPVDKVGVQTAIGVPPTGLLDGPTRARLLELYQQDELSAGLFFRITGRASTGLVATGKPEGTLHLGDIDNRVQPLATALMAALVCPGRISVAEQRFSPDLRALSVLWRYKKDEAVNKPMNDRETVVLAMKPGALDELSPDLIAEILSTRGTRTTYADEPWINWALGELGHTSAKAKTRQASNQRILEYFEAAGDHSATDDKAWCAAFVTWALLRSGAALTKELPPKSLVAADFASPKAEWGEVVYNAGDDRSYYQKNYRKYYKAIKPGDIVTMKYDGVSTVNHVAFVLSVEPDCLYALGGNQKDGQVCIRRNESTQIYEVRRLKPPTVVSPTNPTTTETT